MLLLVLVRGGISETTSSIMLATVTIVYCNKKYTDLQDLENKN